MILRNQTNQTRFIRVNEVDTLVLPGAVVALPDEVGRNLLKEAPADWAVERVLVPPPPPA